jgi:transketolase
MQLAVKAILNHHGPVYMRTGRSDSKKILDGSHKFNIGKATLLKDGVDVTIVACGVEVSRALEAAKILHKKNISAAVLNMSTIKPIDREALKQAALRTGCFVTAEDHNIIGGLGSAVSEVLALEAPCPIEFVGVQDCFGESGEPEELAAKYRICSNSIVDAAEKVISRKKEL